MNKFIEELNMYMEEVIEKYVRSIHKIKTGRANPNLISSIKVDYYGTPTELNQTSRIAISDAQMLVITPYDRNTTTSIAKSLNKANLGLSIQDQGNIIRVIFPVLTEELRKEYVKKLYKENEIFKIQIRNVRRDIKNQIKKDDDISENMLSVLDEDIDKTTKEFIQKLDNISKDKEKELITI